MKKSKRFKKILIVLIIILISAVGICVYLYSNPQIEFVFKEYMNSFKQKADFYEVSCDTVESDLYSLLEDNQTVLNQSLLLINTDCLLPDDFSANVIYYKNTEVQMNFCVTESYENLSEEISEKFDEKLYISSAYRSSEDQSALETNNKYATQKDASEHQAGLALDVYVKYHSGKSFLKSDVGQFVNKNCWQYGFIIRYPYYGKKSTGIEYEPWHLRYVGLPHSEIIYKNSLTLEEYIENLEYGKFYAYKDWIITRQKGDTPKVPKEYVSVTISPDNSGGRIYTFKVK
ncbi:MAG: D-alanyl-D-alanine carboxypeptidase family protein [Candidatus Fimenecus sp.]